MFFDFFNVFPIFSTEKSRKEAFIGEKFDMSFECCGVPAALNSCIEVTVPGGTVCVVANMPKQVPLDLQVACRHEVHLDGDLWRLWCAEELWYSKGWGKLGVWTKLRDAEG